MVELLESEKRRYAKLMELEGFGYEELVKLKNSKVGIVGLTGVGVSTLLSVVTSGVSFVKAVDFNSITENSLPQGTFFGKGDIGKLKTIALKEKLVDLRLVENISISNVELRESNVDAILQGLDLVIYASYNRETIKILGEYCKGKGIPFVWTIGCKNSSYLLYAPAENVMDYIEAAIQAVDPCFKCDCYYASFVSSIAGGAAAAVTVNALLGRATPMLRKCDANTMKVEFLRLN
jgi:molybdopterin/thiamine biosynthesis adenylyltransferase